MYRLRRIVLTLAVIAAVAGAVPAAAAPPLTQTSDVYYFAGGQVMGAESTLARKSDSIHMQISTKDLDSGAAYTVWWVIFNNPEACEHPIAELGLACGEGDLPPFGGNANVMSSVLFAAGHVVGNNGKANFNAKLKVGQLTSDVLWGNGVTNPLGAEIHLVVRSHGQPVPGMVSEQIHTFAGACGPGPDFPLCEDQQFAAYPAPE